MDPLVSIIIHNRNDVQALASRSIIWSACAVSRPGAEPLQGDTLCLRQSRAVFRFGGLHRSDSDRSYYEADHLDNLHGELPVKFTVSLYFKRR
jgi:hypothetical protein